MRPAARTGAWLPEADWAGRCLTCAVAAPEDGWRRLDLWHQFADEEPDLISRHRRRSPRWRDDTDAGGTDASGGAEAGRDRGKASKPGWQQLEEPESTEDFTIKRAARDGRVCRLPQVGSSGAQHTQQDQSGSAETSSRVLWGSSVRGRARLQAHERGRCSGLSFSRFGISVLSDFCDLI